MDVSFGTRLRLHRERQQVALSAIAERTKIKVSLLDGLERDDLSHWPGGIFRRSYVRAYAHAIGLEPDAIVTEFLARFPDPVDDAPTVLAGRQAEPQPSAGRPPTRLGYLISSAIEALPALRFQSPPRSVPGGDLEPVDAELTAEREQGGAAREPLAGALMRVAPGAPASVYVADDIAIFPAETQTDAEGRSAPAVAGQDAGDDLEPVAALCRRLACAAHVRDVSPVLEDAVGLLDAVGVILWTWESRVGVLRPAIAHGYTGELIAQLPRVRPDADNAVAWAFRSAETRIIDGSPTMTGAVAVPLLTPAGCAGVLALELRHGGERRSRVRVLATILAAQLSTLVEPPVLARAVTA